MVVLPATTEQVSQVVKLAAETRIPIVPRGMGSGLAAGSVPYPSGGIVVSLTRMNHILEIDTENATVRAEAGVVTADLQAAVEKLGLFYPPDPSSIRHSTIGGNIACNAGGPRCLKYGVTGDYVLGLTVVLADGRILKTGGKPIKDVIGYDLNGLFTGSEGTLGSSPKHCCAWWPDRAMPAPPWPNLPPCDDASRTVNAILHGRHRPGHAGIDGSDCHHLHRRGHAPGPEHRRGGFLIIETDGADEQTVAARDRGLRPDLPGNRCASR